MRPLTSSILCFAALIAPTAQAEEPARLGFGFDLLPYVGTSSVDASARRVVSFNLIGGLAGGLDAFELGAAFNLQTGLSRGVQIAGAFNLVDADLQGLQIAGGLNLVTGELEGVQLAPAQSVGRLEGLQLGAVNVATGPVEGVQLGAVNVATGHVDGVQIGAINIAPSASAGVGVLNVYWDGWFDLDVGATETGLALVGVRHGSAALYNTWVVGTHLGRSEDFAFGLGIGAQAFVGESIELSIDLTSVAIADEGRLRDADLQVMLRPQIAWRASADFALWAGPTLNLLMTSREEVEAPGWASELGDAEAGERSTWLWAGFGVGVRLL